MKRIFLVSTLLVSTIALSLQAAQSERTTPSPQQNSSFQKFLTTYAGCCLMGTYAYLYWQAQDSPSLSHGKLFMLALGYTGAGFSMAATSYFATILWSESKLLQDKKS